MKMVKLVDVLAVVLMIATFTPLVIPVARATPAVAGIPYTMWAGFLVSVLLVGLTAVIALLKSKEEHGH